MSVYLALFIFGGVFHFLVAFDAVRLKNTLQVIGVLLFNIALIVTACLSIPQVRDALADQDRYGGGVRCQAADTTTNCEALTSLYPLIERFLIVVPVVLGVFQFILIPIAWGLWREFAWSIYVSFRRFSPGTSYNPSILTPACSSPADATTDQHWRGPQAAQQIFLVSSARLLPQVLLLWRHRFHRVSIRRAGRFGPARSSQTAHSRRIHSSYLILIAQKTDPAWIIGLTIAAVPIAALVLIFAAFSARRENAWLESFSLFVLLAGLTYFVYKLTRMYTPNSRDAYRTVRLSLTFISVFAIVSPAWTGILKHYFLAGLTIPTLKGRPDLHDPHGPRRLCQLRQGPQAGAQDHRHVQLRPLAAVSRRGDEQRLAQQVRLARVARRRQPRGRLRVQRRLRHRHARRERNAHEGERRQRNQATERRDDQRPAAAASPQPRLRCNSTFAILSFGVHATSRSDRRIQQTRRLYQTSGAVRGLLALDIPLIRIIPVYRRKSTDTTYYCFELSP